MTNDPPAIKKVVEKNNVNVLQFPPQFAAQYEMSDAKIVFTSGSEAIYDVTKEIVKYADYVNAYGPTEETVWSTVKKIGKKDKDITIGKPIGNTQCYILNKNMKIMPVGIAGELFVGGDGLTKGYL